MTAAAQIERVFCEEHGRVPAALISTMAAIDVQDTLQLALDQTGIQQIQVKHRITQKSYPEVVYFGRHEEVLTQRERINQQTLQQRRNVHRQTVIPSF